MSKFSKNQNKGVAVSSDGVSIHYEVHGYGEPALFFVHGWCCDRTYWSEQILHFSKSYRVVSIDLAGHGDSGYNRKDWTMQAFGEDVVSVINDLNPKNVILIGHSMGGPVVLEAARALKKKSHWNHRC